ncbi:MAG: S-layer homology domain-containing protein [Oscillospiraceae bacterium]|nr:S-layer homology domain-containing protein [Oscillospiraceae bacterium]
MKKRLISLVLILALLLAFLPAAGAVTSTDAASRLHSLGLFQGVGQNADGTPDFALGQVPTRAQAITMFVRLIGASEAAYSGTWQTPFTDVPEWARPYVGYAYTNGLTNGIGPTTFGSQQAATASQYLTFILRALGYTSGTDFQWDRAWELTDTLGITNGRFHAATTQFLRGDVAVVSFDALSATFSDSDQTLYASLIGAGMFTAAQWEAAQSPGGQTPAPPATGDVHALVGTWAWDESTAFAYVFDADGTGFRGVGAQVGTFAWETTADGGLILTLDNPLVGFIAVEQWSYVIDGRFLTLTSRQVAGMEYVYVLEAGPADQTGNALLGTWTWDGNATWAYIFEADGTGSRPGQVGRVSFVWWTTADGGLAMEFSEYVERWSYVIAGDVLTITNRQFTGVEFRYHRG